MPLPVATYQRIFAIELRMVLPKARRIVFHYKSERYVWLWDGDSVEAVRHQQDTLDNNKEAGAVGEEEDAPCAIGLEGWNYHFTHPHWPTHTFGWRQPY